MLILFILLTLVSCAFAASPAEKIQEVDQYLNKAVLRDYSGSVLVAYKGKILLEKGYGMADRKRGIPFQADTVFDIGSITKQFTAAAILKLEMQGKLSVNDPISKYIDGVPEDKKNITIHQLLTHTSGLPDAVGEDEELITKEEYLRRTFTAELENAGDFSYSNVGFSLLAMIVEKAGGQDYERYIYDALFVPAGMKSTGYVIPAWNKDKVAIGYSNNREWGRTMDMSQYEKGVTWHLKGNGGIHSTVGDMYKWYRALQGTSILSDAAKKKLFAKHVLMNAGRYYGYGWGVDTNDRNQTVIAHNGGNGFFMATFAMIPSDDSVVIVSSNNNPKNTDVIATRIDRVLFENLQPLDKKFLATYAGKYALPGGGEFSVQFDENDAAQFALNDAKSYQLLSGSKEDDPKIAGDLSAKAAALWKAIIANDIPGAVAAAPSGVPEEEARAFLTEMRANIASRARGLKSAEVLGTVSRRQGTIQLTAVRIAGEKAVLYQLIVWRGGKISEMRPAETDNLKPFDHESEETFFSDSNQIRVQFRMENSRPVAVIGDVIATKKD